MHKIKEYYPTTYQQYTTEELLLRQSKGKFLTPEEKKRVVRYAENKRKQKRSLKSYAKKMNKLAESL